MRLRCCVPWLFALLVLAAPARLAGAAPPGPRPQRTFQLPNGLHVALAPDPATTTVDVALWFPAGSRYEHAGQSGLTHLFDGLLFAGTPRHPSGDHQRLIQQEGGIVNAYSSPDFACVDDNVPPAALDLALGLEADRMAHLALTARSLDAARTALRLEHQNSVERSPLGRSLRRLYDVAFEGHPYRMPVQGNEPDLARITLPVAQAWWRDHYGPTGTLLTVSGQFDPDSAEALVRRAFRVVPARAAAHTEPAPPPRQILERRATGTVEAQVPLLLMGWRTASESSPEGATLEVLDRLLSHGSKSRLERALISDSSACLDLESGLDLRRDGGIYYLVAAVRPGLDSTQAEREILDAFEQVIRSPVAAADLDGAVRRIELETMLAWQTSQGVGRAIGTSACVEGDFEGEPRRLERARGLTADALHEVVERTFTEAHRSVLWLNPVAPSTAPPPGDTAPRRAAPRAPAKKGGR